MNKIFCVLALMVVMLSSCEKNNILDIKTTYCTATINGEEYKDVTTVREELGRRGYPFATKERIFIGTSNNLAYIQFQLSDANGKICYYLFGGIPFGKEENFPILNKEVCFVAGLCDCGCVVAVFAGVGSVARFCNL